MRIENNTQGITSLIWNFVSCIAPKNNSLGLDSIAFEFYDALSNHKYTVNLLIAVMHEALFFKFLNPRMQTDCFYYIKKDDPRNLANWRPLSLSNIDAKMFTNYYPSHGTGDFSLDRSSSNWLHTRSLHSWQRLDHANPQGSRSQNWTLRHSQWRTLWPRNSLWWSLPSLPRRGNIGNVQSNQGFSATHHFLVLL